MIDLVQTYICSTINGVAMQMGDAREPLACNESIKCSARLGLWCGICMYASNESCVLSRLQIRRPGMSAQGHVCTSGCSNQSLTSMHAYVLGHKEALLCVKVLHIKPIHPRHHCQPESDLTVPEHCLAANRSHSQLYVPSSRYAPVKGPSSSADFPSTTNQ